MGHFFGWSGRSGVDRCRCGTERELREEMNPPFRPFWFYDLTNIATLRAVGYEKATRVGGRRLDWPCPKAAA